MKFKKAGAVFMAAALGLSLVGCGSGSSDSSNGSDDSSSTDDVAAVSETDDTGDDESSSTDGELSYGSIVLGESYTDLNTTIKWLHHKTDRDGSGGDGTIQNYIAEFNKVYPNIKVETEAITDYAEDSLLRLTTGDWGDIMFIPAIDKAELSEFFIPYGSVSEMDEYINFSSQWELDGQCYGIGYMGNAQGVLYNKKVLAKPEMAILPGQIAFFFVLKFPFTDIPFLTIHTIFSTFITSYTFILKHMNTL